MDNFLEKKIANVEYVIFDLDGTLVDSNGVNNNLDIELARSLGETGSDEDILRERSTVFKKDITGDIYLNYCQYLKTKFNSDLSKEEILQRRRDFSREASKTIEYKPNADKFIKYLKANNIKLALGTVSRMETIDIYSKENQKMKDMCNIKEYFDVIITKDDVVQKKPDPEVYNKIIDLLGVDDLSKCIVIEDSLAGVLTAKNANLDVIVVYDKYCDKDREKINELADYKVLNFDELIESFKKVKEEGKK